MAPLPVVVTILGAAGPSLTAGILMIRRRRSFYRGDELGIMFVWIPVVLASAWFLFFPEFTATDVVVMIAIVSLFSLVFVGLALAGRATYVVPRVFSADEAKTFEDSFRTRLAALGMGLGTEFSCSARRVQDGSLRITRVGEPVDAFDLELQRALDDVEDEPSKHHFRLGVAYLATGVAGFVLSGLLAVALP